MTFNESPVANVIVTNYSDTIGFSTTATVYQVPSGKFAFVYIYDINTNDDSGFRIEVGGQNLVATGIDVNATLPDGPRPYLLRSGDKLVHSSGGGSSRSLNVTYAVLEYNLP